MSFPYSVNFNNPLKSVISPENQDQVFLFIKCRILEKKASNIQTGDNIISYKGSTSRWRGSLFRMVDDGFFALIFKNHRWALHYHINCRSLFIDTSILTAIFGFFALLLSIKVGWPWWSGLLVWILSYLWIFGANWITIFFQHRELAADISIEIDELISGKIVKADLDKMDGKLSNWF